MKRNLMNVNNEQIALLEKIETTFDLHTLIKHIYCDSFESIEANFDNGFWHLNIILTNRMRYVGHFHHIRDNKGQLIIVSAVELNMLNLICSKVGVEYE